MLPEQYDRLTMRDYNRMYYGRLQRSLKEQDQHRELITALVNFGGMGAKKLIDKKELMPMPLLDNLDIVLPIRSFDKAMELYESFKAP